MKVSLLSNLCGIRHLAKPRGRQKITTLESRSILVAVTLGLLLGIGITITAMADDTVQMISHRYPALEFYAKQMREAVPGVEVNTQLMPHDKAMELATIAMSSKADTIDLLYLNDSTFLSFAKNGWLRPLDDLFEKYKDEFDLGDFADSALDTFRYEGKLYVIPHTINTQLFFYRKDLLDEAGGAPPRTLTNTVNSPKRCTHHCAPEPSAASSLWMPRSTKCTGI